MPLWPAPSSSPSRASMPPSSPLVYTAKTVSSGTVGVFRDSPRLLLRLLLLQSSSHGEPPTRLQAISHDPFFSRSKPFNHNASRPLRRAHRRPRSPPVIIVFLINGAAPCSSSLVAPSSTAQPSMPSSFLLSSSPPSDLSSSSAPSLTGSAPTSFPPSPSSIATPQPSPTSSPSSLSAIQLLPRHPQPHLTHLNLPCNALSESELHRPSLSRRHTLLLRTLDLSPAGHHCLNIIPRRPPLASYYVAIIGHPDCTATESPPPLLLSSRETKEGKPSWVDMGKMRKER